MACITDLPAETLLSILEYVCQMDLSTFLTSQATSKTFRILAQDVLLRLPLLHPDRPKTWASRSAWGGLILVVVPSLIMRRFSLLFRSTACFTTDERRKMSYLTLDGDWARPFRRLPWARAPDLRAPYLRPGASWRGLSVTLERGPPVTHLDVVKSYSSVDLSEDLAGRDHVQYLQVDLSAHGGGGGGGGGGCGGGCLTVGLLYDLLLCGGAVGDVDAATFGGETGGWELLLGRRLRSCDVLLGYECFIADDDCLVDSGPDAAQAAILYVRGGPVAAVDDQDRRFADPEEDDEEEEGGWVPEVLGVRPKLLPWQGPEPDISQLRIWDYM